MPDDRVAERVSADMERIFRRQDLPPAATAASARVGGERSRHFVLHASPARRSRVRLMRALTIAIPLLTIAVAAFLFLQIGADIRPAPAIAQSRPAARPITAPAVAVNAPTRPAPVAYTAIAPAEPVTDADEATTPPRPTPAAPVRRARAPLPALAATSAPVAGDHGCVPGSDEDMCIYREVREADRRLVSAYRAAAEAGVPRREMVAIRRVWTRALAVSLDDPDGTIRTYDDLARRLRDAARAMQADGDQT